MKVLFALFLAACATGPDPVDPAELELTEEGVPNVPVNVEKPPENALKTKTGIAYRVLKKGTGTEHPVKTATVTVQYAGWQTDGTMFDSSYKRPTPASFSLNGVIEGWGEGLVEMVEGERRVFWIPEDKAYKGQGSGPKGMLVFDIELLSFENPPVLPEDQYTAPADAKTFESGLAMKTLEAGTGTDKPQPDARVEVQFTGWKANGDFLQSTAKASRTPTFRLTQVIPGWSEGLQNMVEGEKARLWIPEALTKLEGMPPQRTEGDVVFDFELVKVYQPQAAPADVAAPPSDARTTKSGLAYKVLTNGEGNVAPTDEQMVRVHYTGWTTDGRMFDTSLDRGEPIMLSPRQVIPGWQEGLKLMQTGDKVRMWIPEDLAYKGKPNRPQGMLVFDVELLEITDRPTPPARNAIPVPVPGR